MLVDFGRVYYSDFGRSIGTTVHGTFKCRKSEGNSRELDVEIHYVVKAPADEQAIGDAVVQMYKVR